MIYKRRKRAMTTPWKHCFNLFFCILVYGDAEAWLVAECHDAIVHLLKFVQYYLSCNRLAIIINREYTIHVSFPNSQ